jgi:chromosome segregation ATPase
MPKPRNLPEALEQLTVLRQSVAALQQQLQEQAQQASVRAGDAQQAFQRQLATEKMQLQSERKHRELLGQTVEELKERLGQEKGRSAQLQQQLESLQEELQEARTADSSGSASHIMQLQWRLQQKQTALISLQDSLQELLGQLKAAGRLAGSAAAASAQKGGLVKQLEAAVQQLLADVASQAALLEQQHQQRQGGLQAHGEDTAALQQQLQDQQQEILALKRDNAEREAAVQQATELYRKCERAVQKVQQANQALERQVPQLQQKQQQLAVQLEGARSELDKALEDRAALSMHLEQCREQLADLNQQLAQRQQQLADVTAERDVLIDRIREFADRQSSCNGSATKQYSGSAGRAGRVSFGGSSSSFRGSAGVGAMQWNPHNGSCNGSPSSMSPEAQQLLSDACAELNQRVAVLEKQLEQSHAKEDKLQLANSQLQERLSAMQVGRRWWLAACACRQSSRTLELAAAAVVMHGFGTWSWQDARTYRCCLNVFVTCTHMKSVNLPSAAEVQLVHPRCFTQAAPTSHCVLS